MWLLLQKLNTLELLKKYCKYFETKFCLLIRLSCVMLNHERLNKALWLIFQTLLNSRCVHTEFGTLKILSIIFLETLEMVST